MNDNTDETRDAWVKSVAHSVAELHKQFEAKGCNSAVVLEGAIKGAAIACMLDGATPMDLAEVLDGFADGFRELAEQAPNETPH